MTAGMGFNLNIDWHRYETPVRVDVLCLILAIMLHVPLNFIKIDASKKAKDFGKKRLSEVVMIDQIEEKKDIPLPAPVPQKLSLADRLKALVRHEPPPPPPPKPAEAPKKIVDAPKEIKLEPKLAMPAKIEPKLQTKEGFQAKETELVQKQISLKTANAGVAPLSAKKLGTIEDRAAIKSDKGNFHIGQDESLKSIGGGPSIADPTAPRIAIATGKTGSKEGLSAPPPQKLDKGRIGDIASANLDDGKQLGLRDRIIARDGATQIATTGNRAPMAGGGAVATKQDAGRFDGAPGGMVGGVPGGTGTTLSGGSGARIATSAPARPKQKKEMFQLTGELKDRARLHQEVPAYPAWAEQKGIEAAVILEFSVEPDGTVKDSIVVVRTTGYPELDELAKKALRKWKFVPLADGENRVEVGRITFNYTLS